MNRDWYSARRYLSGGQYIYEEFSYPGVAKPNRNQLYTTVLRYDGSNWTFFIDNVARGSFAVPDIGSIRQADTGGEITDDNVTDTGGTSSLAYQLWGHIR